MRPRLTRVGQWRVVLGASMAIWVSLSDGLAAQTSIRIQSAWVHDHVIGVMVGGEARKPIGSVPPRTGNGPRVIERNWMLTGMISGGINFNGPGAKGVGPLVYAHGGVLRRLGGGLEPRVGVVGAAYLPAGSVGPAVRADLMDVAAVQVGWMFDSGPAISIEVVGRFVCDLVC